MEMKITLSGKKKITAAVKGFTIETDQAKEDGGDNTAPTPFDLFLASIGTCAAFYVQSFCEERDISSSNINLTLDARHDEQTGRLEEVAIRIQLPPGFPEKYKKTVVRAAHQCAVKKAILSPPEFKVSADLIS